MGGASFRTMCDCISRGEVSSSQFAQPKGLLELPVAPFKTYQRPKNFTTGTGSDTDHRVGAYF